MTFAGFVGDLKPNGAEGRRSFGLPYPFDAPATAFGFHPVRRSTVALTHETQFVFTPGPAPST